MLSAVPRFPRQHICAKELVACHTHAAVAGTDALHSPPEVVDTVVRKARRVMAALVLDQQLL